VALPSIKAAPENAAETSARREQHSRVAAAVSGLNSASQPLVFSYVNDRGNEAMRGRFTDQLTIMGRTRDFVTDPSASSYEANRRQLSDAADEILALARTSAAGAPAQHKAQADAWLTQVTQEHARLKQAMNG
jgi:hypothetical protein